MSSLGEELNFSKRSCKHDEAERQRRLLRGQSSAAGHTSPLGEASFAAARRADDVDEEDDRFIADLGTSKRPVAPQRMTAAQCYPGKYATPHPKCP